MFEIWKQIIIADNSRTMKILGQDCACAQTALAMAGIYLYPDNDHNYIICIVGIINHWDLLLEQAAALDVALGLLYKN